VIFSLFANSNARSKGILRHVSFVVSTRTDGILPNTFQVHGTNLDNVSCFFTFEDAVSATSGHTSDIKQLGAVDHVVI
jgi:hypothetical protein